MFCENLRPERCKKYVNLVDLVKSFPTSIFYLFANIGFDTTKNEPSKVCKVLDS